MNLNHTKRPSFVHWLRTSGQISPGELRALTKEWNRVIAPGPADHKVFTTAPIAWDQFLAGKYPRQFIAYQAFLRLTGAAPTLRKD